ncbi:hypothetical protein E1B28_008269 [Marasmius oreades]|uniref:Acid phosphatase n=1 Tax=Marasmius oreades TaxID=181124 RepID=A0A9P7RYM6_9AGAR|nr:uncharacterized protein E1B28_008269 [Marasmius oreades]KAG7091868.1 hypothetical protein E1B28_008269 [Marasmius oreades]
MHFNSHLLPVIFTIIYVSSVFGLEESDSFASRMTAQSSTLPKVPATGLDVDRYPVGPEGLELEQVHVYVRHGERTPVGVRLNNQPANIPEHWSLCKTARQMQQMPVVNKASGNDLLPMKKLVERTDGSTVEAECLLGELTDLGRKSTLNYGTSLRKLYIDKLGFLPDTLEDSRQVYFRTTNMPRTTESLQQIVSGLYPSSKCNRDGMPSILVRNGRDENLIGNTSNCKRLEVLLVGFAQAAASAFNPTLEPLDKKLSKYLGGKPIRVDGKPRASGIMDTIRAAVVHGIKVPPEFEDKNIVDTLERAVITEWFSGALTHYTKLLICLRSFQHQVVSKTALTHPPLGHRLNLPLKDRTEEVRRLGMGRLLDDLSRKMQHKADYGEKDPLKILLHSTHDTGIAAVCSTLDVFDDKWPAFTASVTFELFKKTSPAPNHSVSMISQLLMSSFSATSKPEYCEFCLPSSTPTKRSAHEESGTHGTHEY